MKYTPFIFFCCAIFTIGAIAILGTEYPSDSSPTASTRSCTEPLTWRIASIDPRFNIDAKTLKNVMRDAGALWSSAMDKDLVAYSDSGEVSVHLVYNEEQKITDSERQLSRRIDKMKLQYTSTDLAYQKRLQEFKAARANYDQLLARHAELVADYNLTMRQTGKTGIIQLELKEKLENLSNKIDFLEDSIKSQQRKFDKKAEELNRLSSRLNRNAEEINEIVYRYKEQFNLERTFYQGAYVEPAGQRRINIYQFDNLAKLRLVLSHELGHALGLGHVENPKSIMFYKMEQQDGQNPQLSRQDVQAIQKSCKR